jgi:hypothetical protein
MVLFFCLFLALRSQDCGKPVLDIKDNELTGETEVYGGYVCLSTSLLLTDSA